MKIPFLQHPNALIEPCLFADNSSKDYEIVYRAAVQATSLSALDRRPAGDYITAVQGIGPGWERLARWRSGYATDCKSGYAGSIPARASIPLEKSETKIF